MIAFACPACRKKLSVKEELAGKKGKCPACGKPLAIPARAPVVPAADATVTLSPGTASADKNPRTQPVRREGSDAATTPPSSGMEATRGLDDPGTGHDASLTNFLAPPQADDELGRLGNYRIMESG